jgi:hypothetical protein
MAPNNTERRAKHLIDGRRRTNPTKKSELRGAIKCGTDETTSERKSSLHLLLFIFNSSNSSIAHPYQHTMIVSPSSVVGARNLSSRIDSADVSDPLDDSENDSGLGMTPGRVRLRAGYDSNKSWILFGIPGSVFVLGRARRRPTPDLSQNAPDLSFGDAKRCPYVR